ncbi:hypothetical protein CNMCM5623_009240 [Aspergillus felis]|uniref:Uncharacterized protein n=1 Tax=Aspergillus felis TaxID=1287682 RepID=A0A8H6PKB6_9EURO|nr:hypothetical protein CNMCM5623_009240 [Aspergillus felis]
MNLNPYGLDAWSAVWSSPVSEVLYNFFTFLKSQFNVSKSKAGTDNLGDCNEHRIKPLRNWANPPGSVRATQMEVRIESPEKGPLLRRSNSSGDEIFVAKSVQLARYMDDLKFLNGTYNPVRSLMIWLGDHELDVPSGKEYAHQAAIVANQSIYNEAGSSSHKGRLFPYTLRRLSKWRICRIARAEGWFEAWGPPYDDQRRSQDQRLWRVYTQAERLPKRAQQSGLLEDDLDTTSKRTKSSKPISLWQLLVVEDMATTPANAPVRLTASKFWCMKCLRTSHKNWDPNSNIPFFINCQVDSSTSTKCGQCNGRHDICETAAAGIAGNAPSNCFCLMVYGSCSCSCASRGQRGLRLSYRLLLLLRCWDQATTAIVVCSRPRTAQRVCTKPAGLGLTPSPSLRFLAPDAWIQAFKGRLTHMSMDILSVYMPKRLRLLPPCAQQEVYAVPASAQGCRGSEGLAALGWFDEPLAPVQEQPHVLDDNALQAVLDEPDARKITRSGCTYSRTGVQTIVAYRAAPTRTSTYCLLGSTTPICSLPCRQDGGTRQTKGRDTGEPWWLGNDGVGVGGRKLAFWKCLPVYTLCVEKDIRLTIHGREVFACRAFVSHRHIKLCISLVHSESEGAISLEKTCFKAAAATSMKQSLRSISLSLMNPKNLCEDDVQEHNEESDRIDDDTATVEEFAAMMGDEEVYDSDQEDEDDSECADTRALALPDVKYTDSFERNFYSSFGISSNEVIELQTRFKSRLTAT